MKIYGPVPSWRLGNSLGVDLVEAPKNYDKICSYNCIYCQLGHKVFRKNFPEKIDISEKDFQNLKIKIEKTRPDYITFSGEGEPTLNLNLGYVVKRIKQITSTPIAVLTNASLVNNSKVRNGLNACDLVIAKIDAPTQNLFKRINQPYKCPSLATIVQSLKLIKTKLAIQTLLFSYNDLTNSDDDSISGLIKIYKKINKVKPITVYLGTAYRPTDIKKIKTISKERLKVIAEKISYKLGIEVVYYQKNEPKIISRKFTHKELEEEVLELLRRRPCTLRDISSRFNNADVSDILQSLIKNGLLKEKINNKEKYYFFKNN